MRLRPLARRVLAAGLLAALAACAAPDSRTVAALRSSPAAWPAPPPLRLERVTPDATRPFDDRLPPKPSKVAHPESPWPFDVQHYDISVALDFRHETLGGQVTIDVLDAVDGADAILLDAVGLRVHAVEDGAGNAVPFEHDGGVLVLPLPESSVTGTRRRFAIRYDGRPELGLYFNPGASGDPDTPAQAFTQGECEETRHWLPCHDFPDDRATHTLHVTVPDHMVVSAAGVRTGIDDLPGGQRTWHYRMDVPHVVYLTTFVAGEFEIVAEDGVVPLEYWTSAQGAEHVAHSLRQTDEILRFFGDYTGRAYPYPKYAQCCVREFMFGGMENISATTLTDRTIHPPEWEPEHTSHGLVAHEAAHQWFGDLITCRHWSHIWLNEGFATYFTHLWTEHSDGHDDFLVGMRGTMNGAARAAVTARRAVVSDVYAAPFDLFFDGHAYGGGAARLHALRVEVGDDVFRDIVRRYVADQAGNVVTTDDFARAASTVAGRDVTWFFDQWFHRPGRPELSLTWAWDAAARALNVTAKQTQSAQGGTPAAYRLALDLDLDLPDGRTERRRIELTEREQTVAVPLDVEPRRVRPDPERGLLARLEVTRPPEEWAALLREAPTAAERLDALDKVAARSRDKKADEAERGAAREAVARALLEDPSHRVRLAAADEVAKPADEPNAAALLTALGRETDLRVRVRILQRLKAFKKSDAARTALLRAAHDPNDLVRDVAATSLGHIGGAEVYDALVAAIAQPGWRGDARGSALAALAELGDPRGLDVVLAFAAPEAPPATRGVAIRAVGRLAKGRPGAADLVLPHLRERSRGLRTAAANALATIADPSTVPVLLAAAAREPWRGTRDALHGAVRACRKAAVDAKSPVTLEAVRALGLLDQLAAARVAAGDRKAVLDAAKTAAPEVLRDAEASHAAALREVGRIEGALNELGVPPPKAPPTPKPATPVSESPSGDVPESAD